LFIKLQLYSLKLFFFSNQDASNTNTASDEISAYTLDFALPSGWALKERQKFGKKGGGKRISKNVILYLEAYFLAGDVDKSEKYTAQEMYNELKELVKEGILEEEEIPKVSTIGNWITRYAQAHRKIQAQQALAQVNGVLETLKI
jgi:hypothetical protein